jgi:HTH-type transcriptional regulator/antitoxin HigA
MTREAGKMIANVDDDRYGALLATVRPGVIANDAELERLTEVVNRLVTKGIKENHLSPEEEKLLALLTRLIEDYEQKHEPMDDAVPEAA